MKHILKHLKPVALLFTSLILLQSCIVYKSKPTSIEKASKYNNRRIKVKTFDDGDYIFRWINEEPDAISSIYETKRVLIDTGRIKSIIIYNPEPQVIQLNEALNHEGMIKFNTNKYNYEFFKVEERNNNIYGYRLLRPDTTSIVIPKENIKAIKLDHRGASTVGTLGIVVIPLSGIGLIALIIAFSQGGLYN